MQTHTPSVSCNILSFLQKVKRIQETIQKLALLFPIASRKTHYGNPASLPPARRNTDFSGSGWKPQIQIADIPNGKESEKSQQKRSDRKHQEKLKTGFFRFPKMLAPSSILKPPRRSGD